MLLFFIASLLVYVSIRRTRLLRSSEIAAFLALYLCALNSKEMALTMPLVLAAYEWAYHKPVIGAATVRERFARTRQALAWLRGPGFLVTFTAALALVSLYGNKFGVHPILDRPAYQPVFSLHRYMAFQKASLFELSGHLATAGWRGVILFWALVTYLAWRRPRPLLRFTWAYMLLTPLPIAFLTDRTQGCLYIPLFGWAVFAAAIFRDLIGTGTDFLLREPVLGRVGRDAIFTCSLPPELFSG